MLWTNNKRESNSFGKANNASNRANPSCISKRGEFCKKEGNKIWRFGIYDSEQLIGTAFFYKIQAKRGTFIFLPHGPNIKKQATGNRREVLEILFRELKKISKEEKCKISIGSINITFLKM